MCNFKQKWVCLKFFDFLKKLTSSIGRFIKNFLLDPKRSQKKQEKVLVLRNIQKRRNILREKVQDGPQKAKRSKALGVLFRESVPPHAYVGHQCRWQPAVLELTCESPPSRTDPICAVPTPNAPQPFQIQYSLRFQHPNSISWFFISFLIS